MPIKHVRPLCHYEHCKDDSGRNDGVFLSVRKDRPGGVGTQISCPSPSRCYLPQKTFWAWTTNSDYGELTGNRLRIIDEVKLNASYRQLDNKQQSRLLTGRKSSLEACVGLPATPDGMTTPSSQLYNYLSVQSHTAPMSYLRMASHAVGYYKPSRYQYGVAAFAIEVATPCLHRVTVRYLDDYLQRHPETLRQFQQEFLNQMR